MVDEFELLSYSPGLILHMSSWQTGKIEENFNFSKRIFNAHQAYKRWLVQTKMYNLAYLNKAVDDGLIKNQVLLDETKAEQKISEIAAEISRDELTKLVLIAGPSSSGKTTSPQNYDYIFFLCMG